jgi:CMP-N-acetylneuraminic acid synthetase
MFTAIVPVKGSSSRLPGKNILPFGESNLLIHKLRQLKQVHEISEIIVSSDSAVMLRMAEVEGVRAENRPSDLANESRPFKDLVHHITKLVHTPHMIWAPVTNPTLDGRFFDAAIRKYIEVVGEQYDSLTTVLPVKQMLLDEKGPFNFNPDLGLTNSQDVAQMYLWTCGCSIISKDVSNNKGFYFGDRPFRMVVEPYQAIDIDNSFDYEIAKAIWKIYGEKN